MAQTIAFYALATVAVFAAFMVVAARNPVRSVLWLILTFFTAAGLFVMLGAEFLAMMLVVVYVGAVAVLFLFVVMMLDVDFVALKQGFLQYMPLGALIALIMLAEIVFVAGSWAAGQGAEGAPPMVAGAANNVTAIGNVLYTDYILFFQLSGMVLLVAMVGAIVLTLRQRPGVKRQDVGAQVDRRREDSVDLVDIEPGKGLRR